jgi:hypothetical protein
MTYLAAQARSSSSGSTCQVTSSRKVDKGYCQRKNTSHIEKENLNPLGKGLLSVDLDFSIAGDKLFKDDNKVIHVYVRITAE